MLLVYYPKKGLYKFSAYVIIFHNHSTIIKKGLF